MDKQGFTAYSENREHTAKTINRNIRYIELFFTKTKKEEIQVTKPDILKHLEYLKNKRKAQNSYRRHHLSALNHYFNFLLQNGQIAENPCLFLKIRGIKRKTLYKTYTAEELDTLFDNYYQCFVRTFDDSHYRSEQQRQGAELCRERNAVILSILIYQGVTTGELNKIELGDIDPIKATLKIRGGRHSNERTIPLKATQIGLLVNYLQNIRPQLLEYYTVENDRLFLTLPINNTNETNSGLASAFRDITEQLKTIDRQFLNFKQVRASVITLWLKTSGLRKAQYLAGHRYVSSTENYLQNNLDGLIDDINKLHPF